jgi:hypothetical protein
MAIVYICGFVMTVAGEYIEGGSPEQWGRKLRALNDQALSLLIAKECSVQKEYSFSCWFNPKPLIWPLNSPRFVDFWFLYNTVLFRKKTALFLLLSGTLTPERSYASHEDDYTDLGKQPQATFPLITLIDMHNMTRKSFVKAMVCQEFCLCLSSSSHQTALYMVCTA